MKQKILSFFFIINFVCCTDLYGHMTCTKSLGLNPLRLKLYSKSNASLGKVKSMEEFKNKCLFDTEKTRNGGEISYVPSSSKQNFLHENSNSSEFEDLNVFVLNFQMINNDIVHVNFLEYENILNKFHKGNYIFELLF